MRLLNETHQRLMKGVRGVEKLPGEIRRSQNWIGGSRPSNAAYVPPPVYALPGVLSAFEKYMHAEDTLPPLIRAGLLHVQFETIHPYLDGNGRIGYSVICLAARTPKTVRCGMGMLRGMAAVSLSEKGATRLSARVDLTSFVALQYVRALVPFNAGIL